jgi:hypothetical protein
MTGQTDAVNKVFEQVMESFRKTAETTLEAQREFYRQWQSSWPGVAQPHTPWLEQLRQFQRQWAETVVELVRKHREALERQHQIGIEALEQAFSVADTDDPEEFRKRAEALCRQNLDSLKEISEAQIQELQAATMKWVEFLTTGLSSQGSSSTE